MNATAFPGRTAIEASQLKALRELIGTLLPGNLFYEERLRDSGVGPDIADLSEFRQRFGFTTKNDLVADQIAHPPFGTNLSFSIDRFTRFHQTSGTSGGAPMHWLDTPESWDWMVGNWAEILSNAGVSRVDRVFFAFSFGPFIGFWMAFDACSRMGCLCIPGGGMSTTARLKTIMEAGCTVVCCTPTYAIRLGEAAGETGVDLAKGSVRRLILAGEPGASIPAVRERLEALWPGATVYDHHGMTEVGPVTFECPSRPTVLHVIERSFLAEAVDPITGSASQPGQPGELVLTGLGRVGSPVLRYRTGDLVCIEDRPTTTACSCGRYDIALLGGILGRTDDMVVVRGVNLYPSAVEAIVRRYRDVREYRVYQFSNAAMVEIEMEIEPAPECVDAVGLAQDLENAMRDAFNLRIPVRTLEAGSLPRFEMKAQRWVRVTDTTETENA